MIPRQVDVIDKADIENLVSAAVPESRTLDYKAELPGGLEQHRMKFLASVCAFANAAGGDIVYGVTERANESGVPDSAVGLGGIEPDAQIRRLDEMLTRGIDPRVPNVRFCVVKGFRDGPVIVLRIPGSFASPHAVINKEWMRFYARSNTSNVILDVHQLSSAFSLSQSISEGMIGFRHRRLAAIEAGDTPVPLRPGARLVMHLLPLSAFDPSNRADVTSLAAQHADSLNPLQSQGYNAHYNADGFLIWSPDAHGTSYTYVQVFRQGAVEAVNSYVLGAGQGEGDIPARALETLLLQHLVRYLGAMQQMGVEPPIFVALAFLGVRGYSVGGGRFLRDTKLARNEIVFPDVRIESYDGVSDLDIAMKPVFDMLWQAGGHEGSPSYVEGRHLTE